jgi:hypothetical protein
MKTIDSAKHIFDLVVFSVRSLNRLHVETARINGQDKDMRRIHVQEVQDMTMHQGDNQSWSNL